DAGFPGFQAVQHLISRVAKAGHNAHSGNHNPSHTILLPVPPAKTVGDFSVSHTGPKCRRFVRFAIFDLGKGRLSRYIMAITYRMRPETGHSPPRGTAGH